MSKFDGKIRSNTHIPDDELRIALKGGWDKELPAIQDEHGITLVGNRRLKIAKAEGITPVIKIVHFGNGPEAEAARIRLANVSNIGGAPLTAEDRKRQAEKLYESGLTEKAIAHMLGVHQATISRDLEFMQTHKSKPAKTATNPRGAGRPKGSGKKQTAPKAKQTAPPKTHSTHDAIVARSAEGKSQKEIADELGVSQRVVRRELENEAIARAAKAEPDIDRSLLSMTAQQKLDLAIRQHKRKLDLEFDIRVREELKRYLDAVALPHYIKQITAIERSIKDRRGIMDRATYRKILSCLHPDRVSDSILKKRFEEAFRLFTELEKRVLDEKESPTEFRRDVPKTYEELMRAKAQRQAENRARYAASRSAKDVTRR